MSGPKIRSAIENVLTVFSTHIFGDDSIMIVTFNAEVKVQLPLTLKQGNEERISSQIAALIKPSGGTGTNLLVNHSLPIRLSMDTIVY